MLFAENLQKSLQGLRFRVSPPYGEQFHGRWFDRERTVNHTPDRYVPKGLRNKADADSRRDEIESDQQEFDLKYLLRADASEFISLAYMFTEAITGEWRRQDGGVFRE